jgi:hypothetical protein
VETSKLDAPSVGLYCRYEVSPCDVWCGGVVVSIDPCVNAFQRLVSLALHSMQCIWRDSSVLIGLCLSSYKSPLDRNDGRSPWRLGSRFELCSVWRRC